ncbi:RICIN domain-containing protein [Streptomyces coeruleorubidus]|uniref:RICIN domain-containing protein n=1 Tax=Streptomyces coeruleorubidus TaxID=116188 RepID=UPI0038000AA6
MQRVEVGRRTGVLVAVTALLAGLLTGFGSAGTAQAATVDTNAWNVLVNRGSGKAVEVQNASTADGAKVVQYTDWGGANQQWQLVRAAGVPAQVHTAGRVKDAGNTVQYSWPGVYFEGRVSGTGVGIVLSDSAADYDVQVDGTTVATLVTPGDTTHWINGLSNSTHTVRLVKRNDTPGGTSAFGGFVAAPGGAVLSRPTARNRQMEFIGDSLTVGYGNLSTSRDCTPDQVRRTTNADVSYGALDHVQQVVKTRNDAGDGGIRYWFIDSSDLDFLGCHWHYSARDDRVVSERLTPFVTGLPMSW